MEITENTNFVGYSDSVEEIQPDEAQTFAEIKKSENLSRKQNEE